MEKHHRKRRSQGGDDSPENIMEIPAEQHRWIHANPAHAYDLGWLVPGWADPRDIEVVMSDVWRGERTHSHVDVEPGAQCPTCRRRVPRPREETETPKQRSTYTVNVPKYEYDDKTATLSEDGVEELNSRIRMLRQRLARVRGWNAGIDDPKTGKNSGGVPAYFVIVAGLDIALVVLRDLEEGVDYH